MPIDMVKEFASIKPEMEQLLQNQQWDELRKLLKGIPTPDISNVLGQLNERESIIILRLLPLEMLPEIFAYLADGMRANLLETLTTEETRTILAGLSPDDRVEFLQELPGQAIQKMLNLLTTEDRGETLRLLGYPEESVGRLMTPDYVAVRPEWTAGEALNHVRIKGTDSETINVVYVTDEKWMLLGVLGLRRLILSAPGEPIAQLMKEAVISVAALEDREKAVELIQRYDLVALPVVDGNGILLGIVTIDDLFDVAIEEVTEDFQKAAAVNPLKTSYRESSIMSLYSRRVIWLVALLGISVITTGIISLQTDILASAISLTFFIPLLIGTGGNAGNQSATLMIRALSIKDIRERQWIGVLLREIGISFLLGITVSAASLALGIFKSNSQTALIVSITMLAIVVISSVLGVILPLILQRLRIDPAIASNPLISSVMDILGLLTYFAIAAQILRT